MITAREAVLIIALVLIGCVNLSSLFEPQSPKSSGSGSGSDMHKLCKDLSKQYSGNLIEVRDYQSGTVLRYATTDYGSQSSSYDPRYKSPYVWVTSGERETEKVETWRSSTRLCAMALGLGTFDGSQSELNRRYWHCQP